MCGIFGIAAKAQQDLSGMVSKMAGMLAHRGPDDEGFYSDTEAMLGNRRLSIIDIEHGHQPFFSDDLSIIAVQDGEIYNYAELRQELINQGIHFRTNSGIEVILRLYEAYGVGFVSRLNGMFAIAIWDKNTHEMHLYRDRMGIKPLFITDTEFGFCFASEMKALLGLEINTRVRIDAIHHYLSFNFVPSCTTMFENIEQLMPGYAVTIREGQAQSWQWWKPSFVTARKSDAEWIEEFRATLSDATKIRLRADVEVGALLCGGLDSSSIIALSAPYIKQPIQSFNIGFNDARSDSSYYAQQVAQQYNTQHYNDMTGPEIIALWPNVIYHCEQPHGDVSFLPAYALSALAAKNVKVVLSGEGSDEMFAGHECYAPFMAEHSGDKNEEFARAYFANQGLYSHDEKLGIYSEGLRTYFAALDSFEIMRSDFEDIRSLYPVNKMSWIDMKYLLPGNNLIKRDRMGMAFGLEARLPFLDPRIVDMALSMPSTLKMRSGEGKYILKEAMAGLLPQDVLRHPKKIFSVLLGEWFRAQLAPLLKQVLLSERAMSRGLFRDGAVTQLIDLHIAGNVNNTGILTALMALEIWYRLFVDGEPPDAFVEFRAL